MRKLSPHFALERALRIILPWKLPMWAVWKLPPVAAPLNFDFLMVSGFFDDGRDLMIQRPVPAYRPVNVGRHVDGVSGQVPRAHGSRGAFGEELLLALDGTHAFDDAPVNVVAPANRSLHDAHKILMHALQPLQRAFAKLKTHLTSFRKT